MRVRLQNISRVYTSSNGDTVHALRDFNLDLAAGTFFAIVGPSGSGKTTLFNILGCLDNPTKGEVFFDDTEVSRLPEGQRIRIRRAQLGYVFQFSNLIPTLTAFENASLPFWSETYALRSKRRATLERLFGDLGIAALRRRYPKELSGGQEQRVAIARALANEPRLILADEPTGNLDPDTASQIIQLLKDQSQRFGTTVLVATHDHSLLERFQGVISLREGWLHDVVTHR